MRMRLLLAVLCIVSFTTFVTSANSSSRPVNDARDGAGPPFDCGGVRCDSIAKGFHAFQDGKLHGLAGNGRSCADCHMPSDSFQLSPASAEARFQALQARKERQPKSDDPLFRAI